MSRPLDSIEIVAVGDELLNGATVDTNAAMIARALEPLGLRVTYKATVGDDPGAIASAVGEGLQRYGAVITTGGLGPTRDDTTKAAVAAVFGRALEFRQDLWEALERRWARRGPIPQTNRAQAEVPVGGIVFANPRGTAPGLALEDERHGVCIMLPGPPDEVRHILLTSVVPYLAERVSGDAKRPFRRFLRTAGITESAIAEAVSDRLDDLPVDVAYLPEIDCNDIRLTGWARTESDIAPALDEAVRRLNEMLGIHIYAEGQVELAEVVGDLLRERGMKLAVAESCTAGLLAKRLTDHAGASDFFWGGMIVYDDGAKIELLGVSEATLRRFGAVSEQTAREMAEGACRRSGAAAAIAVTGIAGPAGGTADKPVGTVWLATRVRDATVAKQRYYPGPRDKVRMRAAQDGLDSLRRRLLEESV